VWAKVWAKMKQLTAKEVDAIKAPGFTRIDDNLYLKSELKKDVLYKSFRLRYQLNGKRIDKSLGSTNKISLKEARTKARELLDDLEKNQVTPAETLLAEKKAIKESQVRVEVESNIPTFKQAMDEFFKKKKIHEWKNVEESKQDWNNRLRDYAFDVIGNVKITEITRQHVFEILEPIWLEKHETATRVRQYIDNIIEWYSIRYRLDIFNPATKSIVMGLPKYTGRVQHLASLHHKNVNTLWKNIEPINTESALATKFLILTQQRHSDVRGCKVTDIDFKAKKWKALINKNTHRNFQYYLDVPLSKNAMAIAEQAMVKYSNFGDKFLKDKFLFSSNLNKRLSESSMRQKVLAPLKMTDEDGEKITLHGFRTTFQDWVRTQKIEKTEVGRVQLSHAPKNDNDAAYERDLLFDHRRELLEEYDEYVTAA
jgi:integrase